MYKILTKIYLNKVASKEQVIFTCFAHIMMQDYAC